MSTNEQKLRKALEYSADDYAYLLTITKDKDGLHGWLLARLANTRLAISQPPAPELPSVERFLDSAMQLLREVSNNYTRDDDLPDDLLPRIDAFFQEVEDIDLPIATLTASPAAPEGAKETMPSAEVSALRAENELLRTDLRFYANGEHYVTDESEEFDTVRGEPQNWLCSGVDDSQTMIEDGEVARSTLRGVVIGWFDGDDDNKPKPIADEAPFSGAAREAAKPSHPQPQAQGEPEVVAWMSPGKEQLQFARKDTVYGSHTLPLITLQSHREAMGSQRKAIEFEAWEYRERVVPRLHEAIAEKDAALVACVEVMQAAEDECAKPTSTSLRSTITQAKKAIGGKDQA